MTTADAPEWYREVVTRQAPPQRDAGPPTTASAADPRSLLAAAPAYTGPQAGAAAAPHWGLATQAAQKHGLDPSLLAAVWDFESSGNPGAINKSSGATGLGQVMPRERGFPDRPTQQELLDPATNAEWSARILKSGLQRYGSEDKALAAYLGAIDARGNITGAVDANGTGGNQYIRTVRERQQRYSSAPPAQAPTPSPSGTADAGAPAWYRDVLGSAGAQRPAQSPAGGGAPSEASVKQAQAASWALSQMGSQAYLALCQRFIENAYGTAGQYRSAAAASSALMKTADPAQADVGDLVFFAPSPSNGNAGHVGIYLGNGEMVGATNAGITRDNIFTNPYWKNLLVGFGDPPSQWQGRASTPDLVKGAQVLTGAARQVVSAATEAAPAWYRDLVGARS